MRTPTTPPGLPTLVLLSATSILPVNMFLPSLAHIAQDMQADYALASLSIAAFSGAAAVLQLVMGPLSDRFGRRPVLLAAFAVFVLASVGCALAGDIWTFLAFRVLQGVVIAGFSVSMAVIRDSRPPEEAASLIGYVAMAWAVAPMLGPTVGGLLDEALGWRANFWTFAGLGGLAFALCWLDVGETNRTPSTSMAAQFRAYPDLVRSRRFWGYALCMAFSVGAFYAFLGGAPLVAVAAYGLTPAELGVYMGTITGGFMVGSFLSGRFGNRFALTTTIIAGRLVACAGMVVGLVLAGLDATHVLAFFGPCVAVGIGNGLTMPASSTGAMSVRPKLAGSASGLAGSMTVGGGALIASGTGAAVTAASGGATVMAIMLAASAAGLLAVLTVVWLDRTEGRLPPATPTDPTADAAPGAAGP